MGEIPGAEKNRSGRRRWLDDARAKGTPKRSRSWCPHSGPEGIDGMKLGTSVRFCSDSPATHDRFRGGSPRVDAQRRVHRRPMGALCPEDQARNLMEGSRRRLARQPGRAPDRGQSRRQSRLCRDVSPLPTVARLMSVTGDMPIGVVLLAPFYHPLLLASSSARSPRSRRRR